MVKTANRMVVKILWVSMLSLLFVGLMNVNIAWAQQAIWTRQFGGSESDRAFDVAVCGSAVYAVGDTSGALPGQTSSGAIDAFVCKYDVYGNLKWIRQFGTSGLDWATGVAVCGSSVYVSGFTIGTFPGQTSLGGSDAFVCKFDVYGNLQWIRQFGTSDGDDADGVSVDYSGVYVAGSTIGTFLGQTSLGGSDAFVCKFDVYGNLKWARQFGTSEFDDAHGVSVDYSGVYVAGYIDGALPGQTNLGGSDAFVCKYDACGNFKWARQFGTSADDTAWGVPVDYSGVYVAGSTIGTFPGQTNLGGTDAFVCKYDACGNFKWARQFGTSAYDYANGVAVNGLAVYIAGTTGGALPGQTNSGSYDAFVCKYDVYGNLKWARQFGTSADDTAWGVSVNYSGVYVAGYTDGALPGETNAGWNDAYIFKYAPP